MNKTVLKLRPCDYWRIGEHECWFADMAAKGLHLKKIGLQFVKFVKGEPKQMRYRIDVSSSNNKIALEQKEMYAESGWEYVTSYGKFNVFSSPVELDAPELHTDSAEQSYTLKALDNKFAASASLVIVAVVLIIAMLCFVWLYGSTPTLALVEGRVIQQVILAVVELYVVYTSLKAAISIRTLRKTLSEGKPIDHNAPWKKHHRITFAESIIFIVAAIFALILPWLQIAMSNTETLSEVHTDLPIVRLADVEKNPSLRQKQSYTQNNIDWGNRYSYDWSLFAPVQYRSDEQGIVPNKMWKDESGEYSPSIHSWVFQISFPFMAESVISDLIKRYGMSYEGGDFSRIEHDEIDLLVVHEGDAFKEVFAAKGRGVIYIRYFGYADINTIIENTVHKIALISD
jgi:hypothetical protein